MIGLFNNIALGFVGHARGGPAKVAVISSGLMGTISGSGVANVLTVGQFTIPLMKRFGYSPVFAGAVEATSSMGGQIMPPVMGAVAFIMAETLNVPYVTIVKAAVIPAFLYYLTAFLMVHLEAGRKGLHGLPKADCPNPWKAIRDKWYLMLPLAVLVFMLFDGFTPMFSGIVGLALTAMLILGTGIAAGFGSVLFRIVFWMILGLAMRELLQVRHLAADRRHRLSDRGQSRHPRRPQDIADHAQQHDRRGQASDRRRYRLRDRRRHHRRADAHRRGVEFRRVRARDRLEKPVPVAVPDNGGVPGTRHGDPDDPELHHHQRDRGPCSPHVESTVDRLAHVRFLFRHHGRPDAAGRACRVRRGVDRQGFADENRLESDAYRDRRFRDPLYGRLRSVADAAERDLARYRVCRIQGDHRDPSLGRGVDRLPAGAAQLGGAHIRDDRRIPAGRRDSVDRRGRVRALRAVRRLASDFVRVRCRKRRECGLPDASPESFARHCRRPNSHWPGSIRSRRRDGRRPIASTAIGCASPLRVFRASAPGWSRRRTPFCAAAGGHGNRRRTPSRSCR